MAVADEAAIESDPELDFGPSPGPALTGRLGTSDNELDEPLPNAERLVAQAVALAGEDHGTASLVGRYWRFAPDEELVGDTPEGMFAAALAHRELAATRLPGELRLDISAPDEAQPHTVLSIVTDDMPFLVDSVTALLTAHQLGVHLLVHPLIVVRRTKAGELTQVEADVEPDDAIDGDLVESWIRVEIDPVRKAEAREQLHQELRRVLTDVRDAVDDWPRMRQRAVVIADELAAARGSDRKLPVPDKDVTDSIELLKWLAHDHFTFLGYREYQLVGDVLTAVPGSGLGILRGEGSPPRKLSSMAPEAHQRALEKRLLVITKANSRATVHRSAYLDYIGVKVFHESGEVIGERRFLGLFSSSAYRTSVRELPVVRRKVAEVLDRSGLSPRGHSGKDLLQILETYPRDELFQIKTDDLYEAVVGVLRMAGRRQLRLFLRRDGYGRFISCLIYLPRDRFTTANRQSMQEILLRELNGVGVDYTTRVTERMLARVHFIVRTDPADPPGVVDPNSLAELLADATRMWDDDFSLVLERKLGEEPAKDLFVRYAPAFPDSYKDGHTPYEAVQDIAKLELLEEPGQLEMHLYRKRHVNREGCAEPDDADVRFKVFRYGEPMLLSAVLPVLHSLGVEVVDERPYEVRRPDGTVYLYDFGLLPPSSHHELSEVRPQVENAFAAAWRGEEEVDGFNELVLRAGLTWRQVVVLRAYAKYQRQTGNVFSQRYVESTFIAYPEIARLLVRLFEVRFSPGLEMVEEERARRGADLAAEITTLLDGVESLDQDRILRSFLTMIQATLRTSFFQRGADSRPKSYVAFKLDPQAIPDLPAPRPKYEIFVYSPRFEGVHLRFGAVARGGLRWSDRREDFRTEVLGLVKAQMVKNAVIVPVGAKGGFVLKQKPGDRDEAVACYRLFIGALLDVTDNIHSGKIVPPVDVVRHDGDDPYLVVAADKGTATFSDIANEISVSKDFWLGDAFASGGSAQLRPQEDGHHGPRCVGVGQEALPGPGHRHPVAGLHRGRRRRHVRRRLRQRDAAQRAHPAGGRVRPPAHLPGPGPGRRGVVRGAPPALRAAAFVVGGLRRLADQRGRRGLPALREVDSGDAPGPRRARPRRRQGRQPGGPDAGHPGRTRRPALERRHRHLREGDRGDARRRGRQGQRRDPGQRGTGPGQGGRRGRQPGPDPARPDRVRPHRRPAGRERCRTRRPHLHRLHRQHRSAWTAPTTRSTSRSCSAGR
nr:hypothetical protein GCM10020092_016070 [Actinoplanes digitatis]